MRSGRSSRAGILRRAVEDVTTGIFQPGAEVSLHAAGEIAGGLVLAGEEDLAEAEIDADGERGGGKERDSLGEITVVAFDEDGVDRGVAFVGDKGEALLEGVDGGAVGAGALGEDEEILAGLDFADSLADEGGPAIIGDETGETCRAAEEGAPHEAGAHDADGAGDVDEEDDGIELAGVIRCDDDAGERGEAGGIGEADVKDADFLGEGKPCGEEPADEALSGGGGNAAAPEGDHERAKGADDKSGDDKKREREHLARVIPEGAAQEAAMRGRGGFFDKRRGYGLDSRAVHLGIR